MHWQLQCSRNSETPYLLAAVNRKLKDVLFTNESIDSIYMYNGMSKLILSSNFYAKAELPTVEWLRESNVASLGKAIPRLLKLETAPNKLEVHPVYSIFYYDRFEDSGKISSMIALNVKADRLSGAVDSNEPAVSDLLAVDGQGLVVSPATGEFRFLQNLSAENDVRQIIS
ncbi:hypothetical protein [Paenibacillus sp. GCM10027626]|uniref:hypothetical protein n=1 Tax=Paenibacillus sp. GCM10027626 TaxID=3273411 RepID=UPI0036332363